MTVWNDSGDAGYDRDDPKHPDYADAWADWSDRERKRRKEDRMEVDDESRRRVQLLFEMDALEKSRAERLRHPSANVEHDLNFMETTGDRIAEIRQQLAETLSPNKETETSDA